MSLVLMNVSLLLLWLHVMMRLVVTRVLLENWHHSRVHRNVRHLTVLGDNNVRALSLTKLHGVGLRLRNINVLVRHSGSRRSLVHRWLGGSRVAGLRI